MSNLIGGLVESAAENMARHAVEGKVNEVIDKKAKEDTKGGKVAAGISDARGAAIKTKRMADAVDVSSTGGIVSTILFFFRRIFKL